MCCKVSKKKKQKLLWLLRKNEALQEQEKFTRDIEKAQTDLEGQTAKLRHIETELEHMRQAHYAAGDRMHQAQGALYQTNSEIGSLEAQIKICDRITFAFANATQFALSTARAMAASRYTIFKMSWRNRKLS
jgi:chromosome segregation ATPase